MGVQDSAALKDSAELIRLIIICKSIGCKKYLFILTKVTNWLLAMINANTRSCKRTNNRNYNLQRLNEYFDISLSFK